MLRVNVEKHIKTIITIIVSILFISCEDNSQGTDEFKLSFNTRLVEDNNGYYHLTLDKTKWQTLHRISGTVSVDDYGVENFWVEWESNLYWYLGDTLGYVVNRYINQQGVYVSVDTLYMVGFNGQEVPTSNEISYSNSYGQLNNMIAPVKTMIGDTMKLTANWFEGSKDFYIVLD